MDEELLSMMDRVFSSPSDCLKKIPVPFFFEFSSVGCGMVVNKYGRAIW